MSYMYEKPHSGTKFSSIGTLDTYKKVCSLDKLKILASYLATFMSRGSRNYQEQIFILRKVHIQPHQRRIISFHLTKI